MDAKTIATAILLNFFCYFKIRDGQNGLTDGKMAERNDLTDVIAPLLPDSVDVEDLVDRLDDAQVAQPGTPGEMAFLDRGLAFRVITTALSDSTAEIAESKAELDQIKWICNTIDEFGHTMDYDAEMAPLAGRVNGTFAEKEAEIERLRSDKNAAYTERNRLVAFIASLFPSQQCKTNIEGWDPEWHGCVFIETPAGQLSWHFHDSDAGLFDHVPHGSPVWDGHTTPEKYERVKSLINIRALSETWGEQEANRD